MRAAVSALVMALALGDPAQAAEPLTGYFIAFETCEAFQSKNRRTNPGDIRTEPRRAYDMIAINEAGGDFFQVRIPDAPVTSARWVSKTCGIHAVPVMDGPVPQITVPEGRAESTDNLLALSWQPAFCERNPSRPECVALNGGELPEAGRRLSVHGLWPQPNGTFFCGVPTMLVRLDTDRNWRALPAPEVDAETRAALDAAMPGAQSLLDRHEWIKHGTCYFAKGGADEYFDDTLLVTDAINGSAVGAFLADRVGQQIETSDLRDAFDAAFGQGAGERVQVKCRGQDGRVLIREITITLRGQIDPATPVATLLAAAPTQSPGCPRGVLDEAGLE